MTREEKIQYLKSLMNGKADPIFKKNSNNTFFHRLLVKTSSGTQTKLVCRRIQISAFSQSSKKYSLRMINPGNITEQDRYWLNEHGISEQNPALLIGSDVI